MEIHIHLVSLVTETTLAVFLIWIIVSYNFLIRKRNKVLAGWSGIDVELKRRHDLVPNLVSTARGYMQHEREVLENVTQARSQAVSAGNNVAARSAAEATLGLALSQVFAKSENYPALRAVESMNLLQEQLASTENRIAYARQFYNDAVRQYNTAQASFPRNLISGMLGFSPAVLFSSGDADRAVPSAQITP
jgi:LemA protein